MTDAYPPEYSIQAELKDVKADHAKDVALLAAEQRLRQKAEREREEWRRKFFAEQKECVEFARSLNQQDEENTRLRALLAEVEWKGWVYRAAELMPACPDPKCRRTKEEGHAPDCRLAAALKGSA